MPCAHTDHPYDDHNIFARILRGEAQCVKVFEDDATLAFMDIMPRAAGHVLVIPKSPARDIFDIAPTDLAAMMSTAQKIAKALRRALGIDGVSLRQFSREAAGQVVPHIHVHVIPHTIGVPLKPEAAGIADIEELTKIAERIRAAL